jgi:predicted HAD superfamily phosphohydrolase
MTDRTWRGASDGTGRATSTLTAPLPPAAVKAMASLDARLAGPSVVRAVTVYETAATHAADLAAVAAAGRMTDLDADSLAVAEDLMAGSRATLTAAGMLHLVEAA